MKKCIFTLCVVTLSFFLSSELKSYENVQQTPLNRILQNSSKFDLELLEQLERNQIEKADQKTYKVLAIFDLNLKKLNSNIKLKERNKSVDFHTNNLLSELSGDKRFKLNRRFKSINAIAADVSLSGLNILSSNKNVIRVGLDVGGKGGLLEAIPQVNIDQVKLNYALTGVDVEVAVLDTGIDTDHVDLTNTIISQKCFADSCPNGSESAEDDNGHGTHVTGIIASQGGTAPEGGAPGVRIHAIKVIDSNNSFSASSIILSGLDHVINELPTVSLVNMSLGTSALFAGDCDSSTSYTMAFSTAVNTLRDRGTLSFVSSMNDADDNGMAAPACNSNAISVGAVWDTAPSNFSSGSCTENNPIEDEIACFSNESTSLDILAPGSPITSTKMGGGAVIYSGTSMATPLALSCAALLLEADATLQPDQIEALLEETTNRFPVDSLGRAHPRIDCKAAIQSLSINQPPTVTIISPEQGATVNLDVETPLTAEASDQEDGDLGSLINWFVDDANVGSGASIQYQFLEGEHLIEAKVSDTSGVEAEDEITIVAGAANQPPVLTLVSPQNNLTVTEGTSIELSAQANDQEDGDLTASINWFDNDTLIYSGETTTRTFTVGTHQIKAEVTDSQGSAVSTVVQITVNAEQPKESGSGGGGSIGYFFIFALLILGIRIQVKAKSNQLIGCSHA